jgi:hypothetical protein
MRKAIRFYLGQGRRLIRLWLAIAVQKRILQTVDMYPVQQFRVSPTIFVSRAGLLRDFLSDPVPDTVCQRPSQSFHTAWASDLSSLALVWPYEYGRISVPVTSFTIIATAFGSCSAHRNMPLKVRWHKARCVGQTRGESAASLTARSVLADGLSLCHNVGVENRDSTCVF